LRISFNNRLKRSHIKILHLGCFMSLYNMEIIFLLLLCFSNLISAEEGNNSGKSLSLFNVVQFKNEGCQAVSDNNLQGVCYTAQECTDLGGSADGNCANGFGTCCILIVAGTTGNCGGTVTQNCSYIQNIDYPSAEAAAQTCTYMVTKCSSDICQIRLDFVTTGLGQPTDTTGVCTAGDNLVITPGGGDAGSNPPTLCGTLTGQHVYVDAGTGTNGATLALTTVVANAADGTKNWRIKVSQIECSSEWRAPQGCLQYFTGVTNIFTSFNWDGTSTAARQLATQDYEICFRQEEGMCKINYNESPIGTTGVNAFDLGAAATETSGQGTQANCNTAANIAGSFIQIYGAEPPQRLVVDETSADGDLDGMDIFCGDFLCSAAAADAANGCTHSTTVTASAIPFTVRHVAQAASSGLTNAGFSIQATQVPCGRSDGY